MSTSIVLIHGGATNARHWDLVTDRLEHRALAVNLPGRLDRPADPATVTMEDAVASVVDDIDAAGFRSVVLVAHSSGGLVIPGLAQALGSRVAHIVFCSASIPPEGGSGLDCMKPKHRASVEQLRDISRETGRTFTTPADPPDPDKLRDSYGTTLTDQQLSFVRDPLRWVADTYNYYFAPAHWSAAKLVDRTYILNLRDRAVPLKLQQEMLANLPGTKTIALDTGHIPAVTMPEVFAGILDGIAADAWRRMGVQ
ncbi:MAG: alpha/beta hydrolase [Acidimicrobiales bacterium]|jgi:pimeloyl-ACP methyl ester carboxylesterase